MTSQKRTKDELLETLRGEIFAAQVKVILDKQLGRTTSNTVKKLAAVKLPTATSSSTGRLQPQPEVAPVKAAPRRTRTRFVTARHAKGLVKPRGSFRSAPTSTLVQSKTNATSGADPLQRVGTK